MGILADIYRPHGRRLANGGISDTAERVVVVNADGPFEPDDDAPAVILTLHAGNIIAVPAVNIDGTWTPEAEDGRIGPMDGGTIIDSCDSRFRRAVAQVSGTWLYAGIHLHDRFETPATYKALSR